VDAISLIKTQMLVVFNQLTKNHQDEHEVMKKQYSDMVKKMGRLEERFIEEEINVELYNKYIDKYKADKTEMEANLSKASKGVSNLEKCISFAIEFASKMASRWHSSTYSGKQQLQFLLFPEGIAYDRKSDQCRTRRVNSVFLYIAYFQQLITNKKRGIPELGLDYASFACLVDGTRQISNFWEDIECISKIRNS
jgi:site-specific DNA recombinase